MRFYIFHARVCMCVCRTGFDVAAVVQRTRCLRQSTKKINKSGKFSSILLSLKRFSLMKFFMEFQSISKINIFISFISTCSIDNKIKSISVAATKELNLTLSSYSFVCWRRRRNKIRIDSRQLKNECSEKLYSLRSFLSANENAEFDDKFDWLFNWICLTSRQSIDSLLIFA